MVIVIACLAWLLYPELRRYVGKPAPNGTDSPHELSSKEADVMGKSSFVLSQRQSKPNEATQRQAVESNNKAPIFVPEAEKGKPAAVPEADLEKAFSNTPEEPNEPMDIDVPEEFEADEEPDLDEEADELEQAYGRTANLADGLNFEEMDATMKVVAADTSTPEEREQAGGVLCRLERTDLFEQMVSGDQAKGIKVKALMAFHLEKHRKDTTDGGTTESERYDLRGFLS